MKWKRTGTEVPIQLHLKLKGISLATGIKLREIYRQALEEWIQKHDKKLGL